MTQDEIRMKQMIEESVMSPLESALKKAKVDKDNTVKSVRKLKRFEVMWDEDSPSILYVPEDVYKLIPPGYIMVREKGEL